MLEIYISRGAAYIGANERALRILGYDLDELQALPFGVLSGTAPDVAARLWRAFVEDGLAIPPRASLHMHTRAGKTVAVRFLGTDGQGDDSWVSRYELLAGDVVPADHAFVLQALLAEWRGLEARVAAADGTLERSELERELAEVKALYQAEQRRRA